MQCADGIVGINVYFYNILWQIYDLKYGETTIERHPHLAAMKDGENKISFYILLQFAATLDIPPCIAGGTNSGAISPCGCGSKYPKSIARGHTTRPKSIGLLEYIQGKLLMRNRVHTISAAKMRNSYCSTKIFSLPGNGTVRLTHFLPSQHETIKAALAAIFVPSFITTFRAEGYVRMSAQELHHMKDTGMHSE